MGDGTKGAKAFDDAAHKFEDRVESGVGVVSSAGKAVYDVGTASREWDGDLGEILENEVDKVTGDGVLGEAAEMGAGVVGEMVEGVAEVSMELSGAVTQAGGKVIEGAGNTINGFYGAGEDLRDGDVGGAFAHLAGGVADLGKGVGSGALDLGTGLLGAAGEVIEAGGAVAREVGEGAVEMGAAAVDDLGGLADKAWHATFDSAPIQFLPPSAAEAAVDAAAATSDGGGGALLRGGSQGVGEAPSGSGERAGIDLGGVLTEALRLTFEPPEANDLPDDAPGAPGPGSDAGDGATNDTPEEDDPYADADCPLPDDPYADAHSELPDDPDADAHSELPDDLYADQECPLPAGRRPARADPTRQLYSDNGRTRIRAWRDSHGADRRLGPVAEGGPA